MNHWLIHCVAYTWTKLYPTFSPFSTRRRSQALTWVASSRKSCSCFSSSDIHLLMFSSSCWYDILEPALAAATITPAAELTAAELQEYDSNWITNHWTTKHFDFYHLKFNFFLSVFYWALFLNFLQINTIFKKKYHNQILVTVIY